MAYVLSVLGCCNLESVVRIDHFCSDHLSRILAHYLSCCECPTDLSLYSALVSYINAIFFSLFSLCFRCTLLEHIFHSRVASICLLQYSIYTLLHITTTTHPLTSRTVRTSTLLRDQYLPPRPCHPPTKSPPTTSNSSSNVSRASTKTDWYPSPSPPPPSSHLQAHNQY